MQPQPVVPVGNLLFMSFPPGDRDSLSHLAERVSLTVPTLIAEVREPMTHVYFPETAMISLVVSLANGKEIETGVVGREGILGAEALLGSTESTLRAMVQVAGSAVRIPFPDFQRHLERSPAVQRLVADSLLRLMSLIAQSAACNGAHSVSQRCARWLLTVTDRVDRTSFGLTQEFLATMLGVSRPHVAAVAAELQDRGLIRYTRGKMTIVDTTGLEATACECYAATRTLAWTSPGK